VNYILKSVFLISDRVKSKMDSASIAENSNNNKIQVADITASPIEADLKLFEEMMTAGIMYGHKKTKTHPKFKQYIHTNHNGIEIIDVAITLSAIDKAAEFIKNQVKENKTILLVATQPAAHSAMEELAKKFNLPYVKNRWIGGLLTNFKVISGRLEYFKKIKNDMEKGEFKKYTKKERVMINRNIHRMEEMFSGLENLTKMPDSLFMIDTNLKGHTTALREARRMKIPLAAIIDSDDDPTLVTYPIPANDHAKSSIEWVIDRIIAKLQD